MRYISKRDFHSVFVRIQFLKQLTRFSLNFVGRYTTPYHPNHIRTNILQLVMLIRQIHETLGGSDILGVSCMAKN